MIQIRSEVFETNSSSTHSICIQKKPVDADYRSITFALGYYGWGMQTVNFADYLYTAIMSDEIERERKCYMTKLKSILDAHHISYRFEEPEFEYYDGGSYLQNGGVDHWFEAKYLIDAVLDDENMLLRGLFGEDSIVYTGNDNCDADYSTFSVAEPYMWVDDNGDFRNYREVPNPYHDEDNFDYFYKGN